MQFIIIDPKLCKIIETRCETLDMALKQAGLSPGDVDHGSIRSPGHHIGIVVDEFGLYKNNDQHWFSIGRSLYAGAAVLYGVDEMGETIDLTVCPAGLVWLRSLSEVEFAIRQGIIARPAITVNGQSIWQWPEKQPEFD